MSRSGSAVEARTPVDVPGVNSGNRPSVSLSSLRAVDGGMRGRETGGAVDRRPGADRQAVWPKRQASMSR